MLIKNSFKKILIATFFLTFFPLLLAAQSDEDAFYIKKIYNTALTESQAYDWLDYLTNRIGGRLSGSPQAAAAVEYTRQMLDTMGLDKVWLQPCMVPRWVRGEKEEARIVNSNSMGTVDLSVVALGNSVGTGEYGLTAEVVEVHSLDEVKKLGRAAIEGKIVFYNRPMNPTQLNTFAAYGGAVDQRVHGAAVAANYGAVGTIVRSMTLRLDDTPHTGVLIYDQLDEGVAPIPALAVSTLDANLLSRIIKTDQQVSLYMRNTSHMLEDVLSYNVIGEITGSEYPDEIILVGGHLDSWDIGTGAHDDGAGCVQSMDVLQLMKRLDYKPKRTIRCVLFMNEENGQRGSIKYMEESNEKSEFHLAAIESDRGGFTPRGFSVDGHPDIFLKRFKSLRKWLPLLQPYGLTFEKGGSGADISRLKSQKGLLFGYMPDSQRYFDYHHAASDNKDVVNKRELELGTAAMLSLIYLIDQYGL